MTYGYIVADFDYRFLVQGMQHAAVLYVHPTSDAYAVHIATDDGAEPYATVSPHHHIAYHHSIVGEVAAFANLGSESAYGFDYRHSMPIIIMSAKINLFGQCTKKTPAFLRTGVLLASY
jgi:hypothetical protein